MTAKEKAQDIYDKVYDGMESGVPKKYVLKCATILVDEMIDYLTEWGNEDIVIGLCVRWRLKPPKLN
jgi:hypothetical protein